MKRFLILLFIALLLGCLSGWIVGKMFHLPKVERLDSFTFQRSTVLLDRYGNTYARYALQQRELLRISQVPFCLKATLTGVEDADFYRHGGIHLKSILRALWHDIRTRSFSQGASTLTMQLARNLFLTRKKNLKRKIEEALLALNLEKKLTKDEILEMYMNLVYLGHGVYGFATASKFYFQKPMDDLQIHEAALLVAMLKAPEKYSPFRHPQRALARRNTCIDRLVELGYLTKKQGEEVKKRPLGVKRTREEIPYPWYAEEVRRELLEKLGEKSLYEKGLTVQTALDPYLQEVAQEALKRQILWIEEKQGWNPEEDQVLVKNPKGYEDESWKDMETLREGEVYPALVEEVGKRSCKIRIGPIRRVLNDRSWAWMKDDDFLQKLQKDSLIWVLFDKDGTLRIEPKPEVEGAVVVMENDTGRVLAVVGGFDFRRSEFNRATQAKRQPGSAFKPFVFAAALTQGYTLADTIFDTPIYLLSDTGLPDYAPENYYKKFFGMVTLRYALEHSLNVCAVKLWVMIGPKAVQEVAKSCGFKQPILPYASSALGAQEVNLLQLSSAYTSFANNGFRVSPYYIEEVSQYNQVIHRNLPSVEPSLNPSIAYLTSYALQGVIQRGTGVSARNIPLPLAGKTGTTNDYTDAWFVGYSPSFTVGVWVGYDVKRPLGKRMPGATAALPIWKEIMEAIAERGMESQKDFTLPSHIVFTPVDYRTGLRATPQCKEVILEAFLPGTEPQESCQARWHDIVKLPYYLQFPFYKPKPREIMGTEFVTQVRKLMAEGYFEEKEKEEEP